MSATLYLPRKQQSPSPTIFTLTPYIGQSSHDSAVYFAARGYPFLTVDVRGRGNSEGLFKANGNEARDGHDIVEWLACQPFCNGKVAMWGGSYAGYVQWAAAAQLPPHLATIAPAASPFRGVDSPAPNNIFMSYRIQWLTLLAGRTSQDKIFADQEFWNRQFREWFVSGISFRDFDRSIGSPSPVLQEWLLHPQQDRYWDSYNPSAEQYSQICLPILTVTGAYDGNQLGALTHYREHLKHGSATAQAQHYLIIGPWDHAGTRAPKTQFGGITVGPASILDLGRLHEQWYAWTMQDGPKPPFLRSNVAYYVIGAEKWRYADRLEQITARCEPLYLNSNGNPTDVFRAGSLSHRQSVASEPDQYVYDPRDVTLAELESTIDPASLVDQRMIFARAGRQLVYHSAPFERDLEVSGFFKLRLWLSIDRPDTDFRVSVHEIMLDGTSIQLSSACMRARYRESLREQSLVTSDEPLLYEFAGFTFCSRQIKEGSRLRLVVGPLDSIFWQKNYNSGADVSGESMRDAQPVTVRLYHDKAHPSVLYVPVGQLET